MQALVTTCPRISCFQAKSGNNRVLSRAEEPEPGVFGSLEPDLLEKRKNRSRSRLEKSQEPEPVEKMSGAGASKKLAGSSALMEDKKTKEIVLLLLFFR